MKGEDKKVGGEETKIENNDDEEEESQDEKEEEEENKDKAKSNREEKAKQAILQVKKRRIRKVATIKDMIEPRKANYLIYISVVYFFGLSQVPPPLVSLFQYSFPPLSHLFFLLIQYKILIKYLVLFLSTNTH